MLPKAKFCKIENVLLLKLTFYWNELSKINAIFKESLTTV